MLKIGFATEFYTLWEVEADPVYFQDSRGRTSLVREDTKFFYVKNVSTDLQKVRSLYPLLEIDESLKGQTRSFCKAGRDLAPDIFTSGKYQGMTIREVSEIDLQYILWILRDSCFSFEKREACKQLPAVISFFAQQENKRLNEIESAGTYGHFFSDASRVEFDVVEKERFGFDTQFGYAYVVIFQDELRRNFKYVGSSPPSAYDGSGYAVYADRLKIKATVEHSEYNGQQETRLKRIKIISYI